jgi:hypothetical protein
MSTGAHRPTYIPRPFGFPGSPPRGHVPYAELRWSLERRTPGARLKQTTKHFALLLSPLK